MNNSYTPRFYISDVVLWSGPKHSTADGDAIDACPMVTSLTDVVEQLLALYDDPACTVKISDDDTCGFLEDKLVSSDGSVTVEKTPVDPADLTQGYTLDLKAAASGIVRKALDAQNVAGVSAVYSNCAFAFAAGEFKINDVAEMDFWISLAPTLSSAPPNLNFSLLINGSPVTFGPVQYVTSNLGGVAVFTPTARLRFRLHRAVSPTSLRVTLETECDNDLARQIAAADITVADMDTTVLTVGLRHDASPVIATGNVFLYDYTLKHFRS